MEKILVKKDETAEILALCKPNRAKEPKIKIKFAMLTRDMFKDNKIILKKYFRNADGQDCYYANLLAFRGIPKINLYKIKKALERDFGKPVSLAGYTYDPEHYRFNNAYVQDEYEEDLFKFKTQAEEDAEFEADRRNRIETIDFNAMESLYTVLYKGIKARLVMILNLDTIPGIINNALDCYFKGVNCSVSNDAMNTKLKEVRDLLENPEVIEWLKTGVSDMSSLELTTEAFEINHKVNGWRGYYDEDEEKWYSLPISEEVKEVNLRKVDLARDYIETYQKVLRQLTDIREPKELLDKLYEEAKANCRKTALNHDLYASVEYFQLATRIKDTDTYSQWYKLIHNEEDPFEEAILANDMVEAEPYREYLDDDEDYLVNNEIFD